MNGTIEVTQAINPNCRVYHTRAELTDGQIETAERGQCSEVNEILRIVLGIPGVVACYLRPYELSVVKAKMFTWEEIEPAVLEILEGLHRVPDIDLQPSQK